MSRSLCISLEGLMGAGKSTALHMVKKRICKRIIDTINSEDKRILEYLRDHLVVIEEPVDEFLKMDQHRPLESGYQSDVNHVDYLAMQFHIARCIKNHLLKYQTTDPVIYLTERSPEACIIFSKNALANNHITEFAHDLFVKEHKEMFHDMPQFMPDAVIFFDLHETKAVNRIVQRGRPHERNIDYNVLRRLRHEFIFYLSAYRNKGKETYTNDMTSRETVEDNADFIINSILDYLGENKNGLYCKTN